MSASLANAVLLDPSEEGAHRPVIGHARVFVANVGRKEFQEPARGMLAGVGNRGRHRERALRTSGCS
jgi:hypothetical protein